MLIRAVVPLALGFAGQTIQYKEVPFPGEALSGVVSYVTDPPTRRLLEALGVVTMYGKFGGVQAAGQSYLIVPHNTANLTTPNPLDRQTALALTADLTACLCTRLA